MIKFRTKSGALLGIKHYHQYVVMSPRGHWMGYDSEPIYNTYGWERQFDMPDEVILLEPGNSVLWKDTKEKVDLHRETKMYCPSCGNLVIETHDQSDVRFCGRVKCYEWIKANMPPIQKCVIFGGGTFNHIACHLSLAAPAFGATAKKTASMFEAMQTGMECELVLTKMADPTSDLVTTEDVARYVDQLLINPGVKMIVMNAAICDFEIENRGDPARLSSQVDYPVVLKGIKNKIVAAIKEKRPDIVVCGFKTTYGDTRQQQIDKASASMQVSNLDLVLANDLQTRSNILVSRSTVYYDDRDSLLRRMLRIAVSKCSR